MSDRAEELGRIALRGGIVHGCDMDGAATRFAAAINTALATARALEVKLAEAQAEVRAVRRWAGAMYRCLRGGEYCSDIYARLMEEWEEGV